MFGLRILLPIARIKVRLFERQKTLLLKEPSSSQQMRKYLVHKQLLHTSVVEKQKRKTEEHDSESDDESDDEHGIYKERGDSQFWQKKMRTLHRLLDVNKDGVLSFDDFKLLAEKFTNIGHLSQENHDEFVSKIKLDKNKKRWFTKITELYREALRDGQEGPRTRYYVEHDVTKLRKRLRLHSLQQPRMDPEENRIYKHCEEDYTRRMEAWEHQRGTIHPYNVVTTEQFTEDMHHILNDTRLRRKVHEFLPYFFKVMLPRPKEAVDKDHDGEISVEEFKLFFECLGLSEPDAEISFNAIDLDKDGKLSLKEFVKLGRDYLVSENEKSCSKYFWGPLWES